MHHTAQRLLASNLKTQLAGRAFHPWFRSAQRLLASNLKTRLLSAVLVHPLLVCSTPIGIKS